MVPHVGGFFTTTVVLRMVGLVIEGGVFLSYKLIFTGITIYIIQFSFNGDFYDDERRKNQVPRQVFVGPIRFSFCEISSP